MKYDKLINDIERAGYIITEPLEDEEYKKIKEIYNIVFPLELQQLYKIGVPTKKHADICISDIQDTQSFYNWHDFSEENVKQIKEAMEFAYEGKNIPRDAPKMVPIRGHRYIPALLDPEKLPVFSIYDEDVIIYGENLEDYISRELNPWERYEPVDINKCKYIQYWSDMCK